MTKLRVAAHGHAILGLLALAAIATNTPVQAGPGYLRYPELAGSQVYFTAEGDLWTAPVDGGTARRLTSHPGNEYLPQVSPDGKWIAFTGEYDGNRDVFVMPVERRRAAPADLAPGADEPLGWTADGQAILFRSWRDSPNFNWELYRVPAAGGDPEKLPIGYIVSFCDRSGERRLRLHPRRAAAGTWKRYRGGTADDIWVGDPEEGGLQADHDFDGADAFPMWHEGRHLLPVRPGRHGQPLVDEARRLGPQAAHRPRRPGTRGWPSMDADGPHRLHARRRHPPLRSRDRARSAPVAIDLPSERILTRTRYPEPAAVPDRLRPLPRRRPRGRRGARRDLLGPGQEGGGHPADHDRQRRARARVVLRSRRASGSSTSPTRRGEEQIVHGRRLGPRRGQGRSPSPARAPGIYQPHLVPGRQVDRLRRIRRIRSGRRQGGRRRPEGDRPLRVGRDPRLRRGAPTAAGSPTRRRNPIEYGAIFIYDTKDGSTHQVTGRSRPRTRTRPGIRRAATSTSSATAR